MVQAQDNIKANLERFRDCLSLVLVEKLSNETGRKSRRRKKTSDAAQSQTLQQVSADLEATNSAKDVEELADFIHYIAVVTFGALPDELAASHLPILDRT
jgi:hypothetical protein